MKTNLNGVAQGSHSRLVRGTVSEKLAAAILEERLSGEFEDWEDVIRRVPNFGPKKKAMLILHGFDVRPDDKPKGDKGKRKGDDDDVVDGTKTVRVGVKALENATWVHRGNTDLYTNASRFETEITDSVQVDHVIEIQVQDVVHRKAAEAMVCTRAMEKELCALVNSTLSLNCTTAFINQKKKGPTVSWLNQYKKTPHACLSLDEFARASPAGKKLIDMGAWAKIEGAIVATYDDLQANVEDRAKSRTKEYLEEYTATLSAVLESMQLK